MQLPYFPFFIICIGLSEFDRPTFLNEMRNKYFFSDDFNSNEASILWKETLNFSKERKRLLQEVDKESSVCYDKVGIVFFDSLSANEYEAPVLTEGFDRIILKED